MAEKFTWTTRDGRTMDIDQMTDVNHLRNIVKMLLRRERSIVERHNALVDKYNASTGRSFVSLNGDMAQFLNDQEENRMYDPNPDQPFFTKERR